MLEYLDITQPYFSITVWDRSIQEVGLFDYIIHFLSVVLFKKSVYSRGRSIRIFTVVTLFFLL